MPFNGSGVFQRVRNWVNDAAAGIKIRADFHDSEDDGFATGLSECITRSGQTTITQNIPFNGKRITGLADPVNDQDAATKKSVTTITDDKVSTLAAGDTMLGNLTISKADPAIFLDVPTGATGTVIWGTRGGKARWAIQPGDSSTEAGANAGTDFGINRYDDAGTNALGRALEFNRKTGLGTVFGPPTADLGIATKKYTDDNDKNRVLKGGDTMTGGLNSFTSVQSLQGAAMGTFEARGNGNAGMTFNIPSVFAANFGLFTDGNFYMGGLSHGAVTYKFWTTRDFASLPAAVLGTKLVHAGDVSVQVVSGSGGAIGEPFAGAVVTGWNWTIFDNSISVVNFRMRYLQVLIGSTWSTVGYTSS